MPFSLYFPILLSWETMIRHLTLTAFASVAIFNCFSFCFIFCPENARLNKFYFPKIWKIKSEIKEDSSVMLLFTKNVMLSVCIALLLLFTLAFVVVQASAELLIW